ncbi:sigma-54-dependent transcriptional regulator [Desulfolutivibrio sulfodismutans]|nr:sigma-54 dependent transcriptional regulator [Desulfolutivibrio sulfodismutans]
MAQATKTGNDMARILIIDDDELIRNSLSRCFADMGHEILLAGDLRAGMDMAASGVDVVYLDLHLPDGDGQKAIDDLAASPAHPEIIVITGQGNNYGARQSLANGAWDYIRKPASPQSVRASLADVLAYRRDHRRGPATREPCDDGILGTSPPMQRVRTRIAQAADSEAGVLLLGETGVGKELAARAIHNQSRRGAGPFVVVDCGNLTESLVESALYGHVRGAFTGAHADRKGLVGEADGGTLFLDEVGELPPVQQKSFLRVLQERRYRPVGGVRELSSDFRLVAATNRDLEAMARTGEFRSDLLFRLRTLEIGLPPLRERGEDIPLLAAHFIGASCDRYGLPAKRVSAQLMRLLTGYPWPGNVRELGNVMEAAVIAAGRDAVVYPKHLPGHLRFSALDAAVGGGAVPAGASSASPRRAGDVVPYDEYKARRDKEYFQELMALCSHDVSTASLMSGLSVPSIYRHLGLANIPTRRRKS